MEPRIRRSLTLHMKGDWGTANLHRVCGWLSQELTDRCGPYTRMAIWNGRGFVDSVRAVGRGEVDLALTTPAAFATCALDGTGIYDGEAYPELRALAVIPQRDRLVVGVHKSLAINTFADLREQKPQLTVATSVGDGINHVGIAARALLDRAGVDVLGWGGEFLTDERPFESFDHVLAGRANAVVHEAVMLPHWQQFGTDFNFLEVEQEVLDGLWADFRWPAATVESGYFPQRDQFQTLDFSDFLMITRSDMPEDVAYTIAWVLGETREIIEQQYRHLPADRSPITYPLDPHTMGIAPIPLHPGAALYYGSLPKT